jgi:hypothetical protein
MWEILKRWVRDGLLRKIAGRAKQLDTGTQICTRGALHIMEAVNALNLNECCRMALTRLQQFKQHGNKINDVYSREYFYFITFIHNNLNDAEMALEASAALDGSENCFGQQLGNCSN